MPELPEVEATKRLIERHCLGKKIIQVKTTNDEKVIQGCHPSELESALLGRTLLQIGRKGKYMWFEMDRCPSSAPSSLCDSASVSNFPGSSPWIMFHLGMTGSIDIQDIKGVRYKRMRLDGDGRKGFNVPVAVATNGLLLIDQNVVDDTFRATNPNDAVLSPALLQNVTVAVSDGPITTRSTPSRSTAKDENPWPPRFWKLNLVFEDRIQISFSDSRRFGRIRLMLTHPSESDPINRLGFDVLTSLPPLDIFTSALRKRSALMIKALLLDQAFLSGIGNWVADEVLYQARIHPEHRVGNLGEIQIRNIHDKIRSVVQYAVENEADDSRFPKDWLFHYRWTGKKEVKMEGGFRVAFVTVGSRTSAFVPDLQKLSGHKKGRGEGGEGGEGRKGGELEEEEEEKEQKGKAKSRRKRIGAPKTSREGEGEGEGEKEKKDLKSTNKKVAKQKGRMWKKERGKEDLEEEEENESKKSEKHEVEDEGEIMNNNRNVNLLQEYSSHEGVRKLRSGNIFKAFSYVDSES